MGGRGDLVFDEHAQLGVFFVRRPGFPARAAARRPAASTAPFAGSTSSAAASSSAVGGAPQFLLHLVEALVQLADAVDHVHRHADGAALVGDGAGDRLADPPGGVGGEAEAALVIVFLDRFHQAQVAFLDQVQERHALPDVALGDADHQAGVGFDQVLAGQSSISLNFLQNLTFVGL